MTLVLADRVKEVTTTAGSGDITLAGGFAAFQTFANGIGNGNTTYYAIENGAAWEVGLGTYTSSSNTLSRDTILQSSNSDSLLVLDGIATVFCSYVADKSVFINDVNQMDLQSRSGIKFQDASLSNSGMFFNDMTVSGAPTFQPFNGQPITMLRTDSGNFFHAYVDDAFDRTISLHTDANASPRWTLGLKNSPSNNIEAPSFGYVYGEDGQAGLVANSINSVTIDSSASFVVTHNGDAVLVASAVTGVHVNEVLTATQAIKTPLESNTDATTVSFDMDEANLHTVQLGGNRTLAVTNTDPGQRFTLRLHQDTTGSRTVTWWNTINWAGGSAPTLTTTPSKVDLISFICVSGSVYDGFVTAQNI